METEAPYASRRRRPGIVRGNDVGRTKQGFAFQRKAPMDQPCVDLGNFMSFICKKRELVTLNDERRSPCNGPLDSTSASDIADVLRSKYTLNTALNTCSS